LALFRKNRFPRNRPQQPLSPHSLLIVGQKQQRKAGGVGPGLELDQPVVMRVSSESRFIETNSAHLFSGASPH
jgi:hypothetical protein